VELNVLINSIGAIVLAFFFLFLIFNGAPFVPSNSKTVKKMVNLASIKPGDKAADLGSGSGKIVIALARAGAEAHGYEINPILIWWARKNIRQAGLEGKAFIHTKNFWNEDFSSFKVITLYGVSHIMKKLETKLVKELPIGARVVSNSFQFPNWRYSTKDLNVFLYLKTE